MAEVNNASVLATLQEKFGDAIEHAYEPYGMLTAFVKREQIIDILRFLKEDSTIQMNFLTSLCGIHYPENKDKELGVIYHLHSFTNNFRMRLEVFFPSADVDMPTATVLWPTANWMEREAFEFFGINFVGHPDLRIILNVEDMDYHPLLKQYPLEDDTRTDKDDRYFGRSEGNNGVTFDVFPGKAQLPKKISK
jgi:NADH-quinone oxidoreductase subunit C